MDTCKCSKVYNLNRKKKLYNFFFLVFCFLYFFWFFVFFIFLVFCFLYFYLVFLWIHQFPYMVIRGLLFVCDPSHLFLGFGFLVFLCPNAHSSLAGAPPPLVSISVFEDLFSRFGFGSPPTGAFFSPDPALHFKSVA